MTDIQNLLDYAFKLSKGVRGLRGSRVQKEASGFLTKQVLHGYTVWAILNPLPRPELTALADGEAFYDYSSLNCLVRVMFELHVRMEEVLLHSGAGDELEFNLDYWLLHSECRRRDLARILGSSDDSITCLDRTINTVIERMRLSPYYKQLSSQHLQQVNADLNNGAESFSRWTKVHTNMAAKAHGYDAIHADSLYRFGSQYTHSSAFSLGQILCVSSGEEAMRLCTTGADYATMLLATTIDTFWQVCPEGRSTFPPDTVTTEQIARWVRISRDASSA